MLLVSSVFSIFSCMHISLNLRTNSQKLWVHFCFLSLFAYSTSPCIGEIASIQNLYTSFFSVFKTKKKIAKGNEVRSMCFKQISLCICVLYAINRMKLRSIKFKTILNEIIRNERKKIRLEFQPT